MDEHTPLQQRSGRAVWEEEQGERGGGGGNGSGSCWWGQAVLLPGRPRKYVGRWSGRKPRRPSLASRRAPLWVVGTSLVGSFLGIFLVGLLDDFLYSPGDVVLLIGSYGATAVLLYAAPASPLSQPLNLVGGHAISSIIGVSCHKLFAHISMPLAAALAVSISIAAMQLTCTLHPPGGASAIIAVLGSGKMVEAGFYYVLTTVAGALVMLAVALVINNLPRPANLSTGADPVDSLNHEQLLGSPGVKIEPFEAIGAFHPQIE